MKNERNCQQYLAFSRADAGRGSPVARAPLPLRPAFHLSRMSSIFVQDFLEISYRSDLNLLVARWLRPIELSEMQRGYDLLLDVGSGWWMLDAGKTPT